EIYQWLLRQLGFVVSNTGYIVYANAQKDRDGFGAKLDFDITLIAHTGSTDWVEPTLLDIKKCLDSDVLPNKTEDCDYCRYRESAGKALLAHVEGTKLESKQEIKKVTSKKSKENYETPTLF